MENNKEKIAIVGITILLAVIIFGALAIYIGEISQSDEIYNNLDLEQEIVYTSPTTLTKGEGITSSTAQVYNDTWLNFDGVDDYINMSSLDFLNRYNNYSISLWVKMNTIDSYGTLYAHSNGSSSIREGIQIGSSGTVYAGYFDGTPYEGTSGGNVSNGQWNHIVYIQNQGNESLYVNGIKQSGTGTPTLSYNEGLFIGYNGDEDYFFNGSIDEFQIYNKTINETEILNLYQEGRR